MIVLGAGGMLSADGTETFLHLKLLLCNACLEATRNGRLSTSVELFNCAPAGGASENRVGICFTLES